MRIFAVGVGLSVNAGFFCSGYMAHKLKKDVSDIAIEGPGLVFIVSRLVQNGHYPLDKTSPF